MKLLHNQHTKRSQGHPQELADYQEPDIFVAKQQPRGHFFRQLLETSEGATSEGAVVFCSSRISLVPKELAD